MRLRTPAESIASARVSSKMRAPACSAAARPAFRPEALHAILSASSTTADQPRRTTSRAIVRPASPPPITHTSTSASWTSAGRGGAATVVAAYHVAPSLAPGAAIAPRSVLCACVGSPLPTPCWKLGKLQCNCDENPRRVACPARWPRAAGMLDFPAPEIEFSAMRRLILLRHAKSDWTGIGLKDRDRALAARGRDSAPKIGAYMAHHALV